MAWSYRRRIKIIPGVHLNISKKGISTTIGVKGASLNFGPNGSYLNTSIPAFGLSDRRKISGVNKDKNNDPDTIVVEPDIQGNIFSVAPHEITSNDMQGIKDTILSAHTQRAELKHDLSKVEKALAYSKLKLNISYILLYGLLKKSFSQKIKETILSQKAAIIQIKEQIDNSCMALDIEFDADMLNKYEKVTASFKTLSSSEKIWDVINAESQNTKITRSAASTVVMKKEVSIGIKQIPDVKSNFIPLWFKNANGADLYFYPGFIIMYNSQERFGIIGLSELEFFYGPVRFVETGKVPGDSKIIDKTWAKVNKNGSPDKRFKDNYQIPIVRYGSVTLKTKNGLHEEYEFSNYEASEAFGHALSNFIAAVRSI